LKHALHKSYYPIQKEKPVNNLSSLQPQEEVPRQSDGTHYFDYSSSNSKENLLSIETSTVLNEQWIMDYFGNDYSIAIPILQLFIEEMLPEINLLETVLQKQGVTDLRKRVHKINPSFKMVGQTALASALTDLENACISFEDIDELKFKIKKIQVQAEVIKPLVIKQLNSISKLA
jgi:HPt (histidine-containing phosphotransfer) domain-containing protein